jgi:hypothetical protein
VAQIQAGAIASNNVNVLLDGMSFKNPINHGGMFGQNFGDFGNPFPQIAIQEYQLETQNFGAENGQSASALLSAVTKTGGDHFHGSAFFEFQPRAFVSKPFYFNGKKPPYKRSQYGGDFGGPIIPGKLTFYVAAEGLSRTTQPISLVPPTVPIPQNILAKLNGSAPQTFHQGLYFGKLTWFADPENTFNLSGFARRQANLADFGGNAAPEHGRLLKTHQTRFQLQWRHSAGNFLNLLNLSYDRATQGTPAVSSGPEYLLTNGQNTGAVLAQLGANPFEQVDTQKSWVIREDATYRAGVHTLKAGGQITFFDLARTVSDHFNGTYFVANPGGVPNFDITTATPYAATINIQSTPTLAAKDTQIGLYVQDEWKPDVHWTVNAGIRWDYESNANNNNYVTPAAIAAALRAYPGWAARGINPEDYISTGNNRKPYWKEFQPRLGLSYDVHGDHDLVIFGGAGRYYDRSLFIEGQIEQQTNSSIIPTVPLTCSSSTSPAYCGDPAALRTYVQGLGFTGGAVWVLPNKYKPPYSDQADIGVRKRFGDITATLTYSHVESHNLFLYARSNFYNNGWYTVQLTPTGCVNGGDQWIIDFTPNGPFTNCPATNGQLTGFSGKLDRGLNNGRARLDALYLQIEKPFTDSSTWGFTEAVTLQRARTNVGQDTVNTDEMFNAPNLTTYGWNYVPGVPRWSSVTSANWRAPLGITLSGILSLNSGPAFGHLNVPWAGGPTPPVGACCGGPANLAGVYFPHKTIGYKRLDMRVAKTFKMPWNRNNELTVDFQAFNVFNWLNRTYSAWGAGAGANPPFVDPRGAVANDQRQFQVGIKYKF